MKFILGKKIKMSQIFEKEEGKVIPITIIEAGPCFITQIKTKEKDGYFAIQIGFQKIEKTKKIKKSMKKKPFRWLKEYKMPVQNFLKSNENKENIEYKIEDIISLSSFEEGDFIKVTGISKGKGFQGGVKRWGFKGRNASHGVKHEARTIGSIGGRFPQRVVKGKKMPGRMGYDRVTVKNLKIIKIDKENNILAVKGALPGPRGTLLEIRG